MGRSSVPAGQTNSYPNDFACDFLLSVCRTVQRSEWDYADLIKHQWAWKTGMEGRLCCRYKGIRHNSEGGIIRGPRAGDVEQFRNLWSGKGFPIIEMPQRLRQKSSLFD